MPDESVEHVIVEGQQQGDAPAAVETIVAAETAVALAGATAAAAELDAAERLRRLEMEGEEWRNQIAQNVNSLSDSLRTLREEELSLHAAERTALSTHLAEIAARQEALEAQYLSLTPPQSEAEAEVEVEEANPTLGTAVEAEAGPVSLGGSLAADVETSESSQPNSASHPVRRRRWI